MAKQIKIVISQKKFSWQKKLLAIAIGLLVVILCLFLLAIYTPKENSSGLKPVESQIFVVAKGQGLREIAGNLEEAGLIRQGWLFYFYVLFTGRDGELLAGSYDLNPGQNLPQILEVITHGQSAGLAVLEGWNIKDIAATLTERGIIAEADFLKTAQEPPRSALIEKFTFLKEVPDEAGLEGYLFPDTYQIAPGETADEIIEKMLANFEQKITPEIKEKISTQKITLFQALTMASLLEKEVKIFADKQLVAGILWKRLKTGWPLQVDATIGYLTGKDDIHLTKDDLAIDSPYNTYKYHGLPLGPICNPGLESILAAIDYQESAYWFYLSAPDGKTIFSKTLTEHNQARQRYLK